MRLANLFVLACLQPITLHNKSLLPQPVVCYLYDADRNPTAQENVHIHLAKTKGLTVSERSDPAHCFCTFSSLDLYNTHYFFAMLNTYMYMYTYVFTLSCVHV